MSQEVVEFPMPGKIVNVNVNQGGVVAEGDVLCILESMKMEIPIMAPVGGKIIKLELSAGQAVDAGDVVTVIEY